jgi:hypothetical protein
VKWIGYFTTTASTSVTVEADSLEEAMGQLDDADMPHLCASCAGWGQSYNLGLGDWGPADETFGPNVEPLDE